MNFGVIVGERLYVNAVTSMCNLRSQMAVGLSAYLHSSIVELTLPFTVKYFADISGTDTNKWLS